MMSKDFRSKEKKDHIENHLTTRRGFVSTLGFGIVSLYGLWAAYGAAPISLSFLAKEGGGGHGGMGHGGGGMSPDEFRRLTESFVEANQLPDGSVKPVHRVMSGMPSVTGYEPEGEHTEAGAKHGMSGMTTAKADGHDDEHGPGVKHGMSGMTANEHKEDGRKKEPSSVDVYLMASRYGYAPEILRLDSHVPYRFRMMAVDGNHGTSINMKLAGRMIRCPARTLVESEVMFTSPGEYLVYCTVYCGEGHDMMMGKIIVA